MRAISGLFFGTLFGAIAFLIIHFNQLLLIGQGRAGLLLTLQLNNAVDSYMFGGAILGLLVVLINKEAK
jgi:hypothetical protein